MRHKDPWMGLLYVGGLQSFPRWWALGVQVSTRTSDGLPGPWAGGSGVFGTRLADGRRVMVPIDQRGEVLRGVERGGWLWVVRFMGIEVRDPSREDVRKLRYCRVPR